MLHQLICPVGFQKGQNRPTRSLLSFSFRECGDKIFPLLNAKNFRGYADRSPPLLSMARECERDIENKILGDIPNKYLTPKEKVHAIESFLHSVALTPSTHYRL